jgi:hypothetical protein
LIKELALAKRAPHRFSTLSVVPSELICDVPHYCQLHVFESLEEVIDPRLREAWLNCLFPGFEDMRMARRRGHSSMCWKEAYSVFESVKAEEKEIEFIPLLQIKLTKGIVNFDKYIERECKKFKYGDPAAIAEKKAKLVAEWPNERKFFAPLDEIVPQLNVLESRTTSLQCKDVCAVVGGINDNKAKFEAITRVCKLMRHTSIIKKHIGLEFIFGRSVKVDHKKSSITRILLSNTMLSGLNCIVWDKWSSMLFNKFGGLNHTKSGTVECIKAASVAIRKSGTIAPFPKLESEEVANCVDSHLGVGHVGFVENWEQQTKEKSGPTPTLRQVSKDGKTVSNDIFNEEAMVLIKKFCDDLIAGTPLQLETLEAAFDEVTAHQVDGATNESECRVPGRVVGKEAQPLSRTKASLNKMLKETKGQLALAKENLPIKLAKWKVTRTEKQLQAAIGALERGTKNRDPDIGAIVTTNNKLSNKPNVLVYGFGDNVSKKVKKKLDLWFETEPDAETLEMVERWWFRHNRWVVEEAFGDGSYVLKHNKRSRSETWTWPEFIDGVSKKGSTRISRSDKLEKARPRAIYAADHKNFEMVTQVTGSKLNIEQRIGGRIDAEKGAAMDVVLNHHAARVAQLRDEWYSADSDAKEFDKHHALKLIAYIYECIGKANAKLMDDDNAKEDYLHWTKWVCESIENANVMDGSHFLHKWQQGMPRGVRGTDFLNFVFNVVYDALSDMMVARLLRRNVDAKTVRQGDDIWKKVKSVIDAIAKYASFTAMLIECQPTKQIFAGGRLSMFSERMGEFLRVLHNAWSMAGYSNRALTSVTTRWPQNAPVVDPIERLRAKHALICNVARRPGNPRLLQELWQDQSRYESALGAVGTSGLKDVTLNKSVPKSIIYSCGELGLGLCGPCGTVVIGRDAERRVEQLPALVIRKVPELTSHVPSHGSKGWVKPLVEGGHAKEAEVLQEIMHEQNIATLVRQVSLENSKWRYLRELAGAITEYKKNVNKSVRYEFPLRERHGVIWLFEGIVDFTELEKWGLSLEIFTLRQLDKQLRDSNGGVDSGWDAIKALADNYSQKPWRRNGDIVDVVVCETSQNMKSWAQLITNVEWADCVVDFLRIPLNEKLLEWAEQELKGDLLLDIKQNVVQPVMLIVDEAIYNPSVEASSRIPKARMLSALAQTKWRSASVLLEVADKLNRSPQSVWDAIPEARTGVRDPQFPKSRSDWKLITEPISMPPVADAFLSTPTLGLCNGFLCSWCEQKAIRGMSDVDLSRLTNPQTQWCIGITLLGAVTRDFRYARLNSW